MEKGRLQTQKGNCRHRKGETADTGKGRLQTQEKGNCRHGKGETANTGKGRQQTRETANRKRKAQEKRQPKLFKAVAPSTRNLLSKHGHGA